MVSARGGKCYSVPDGMFILSRIVFAAVFFFGTAGFGPGLASGHDAQPGELSFWDDAKPASLGVESVLDANFQQIVVLRPRARAKYAAWRISILDSSDRAVQTFSAAGSVPARLTWLGVGLDSRLAPDGFYRAQLKLTGGGKDFETPGVEFSFMQPPELASLNRQPLVLLEDGDKIVVRLPKLIFESGSTRLSPEAANILGAAADFLKSRPRSPAFVLGYTDDRGDAKVNDRLSRERASAVYAFLVDHDVAPERLRYKGLGFQNPISSNATEDGRAQNRRVEIWMSKTRVTGA